MFRRPPWLTYAFAAVTLASVAGYDFLMYLRPEVADWLLWLNLACVVVAVVWLVVCAFLRKPRGAPVLLATLLIFYAPHLVASEEVPWLISLGFRLHASPIEQYLKNECRLIEFTEQGATKVIGACESREVGSAFNVVFDLVIYDPTGALSKPERRTPEWTQAWHDLAYGDAARTTICGGPIRLFDHFYHVCLT